MSKKNHQCVCDRPYSSGVICRVHYGTAASVTSTLNSRSQMKRIAVQEPELMIKEIERLRAENVALQIRLRDYPEQNFERKYLREHQINTCLREALCGVIREADRGTDAFIKARAALGDK